MGAAWTKHVIMWDRPLYEFEGGRLTSNLGLWTLDFGLWTLDFGLWTLDLGLWTLDFGLWTLDFGLWTLDFGLWTLDFGLWTLDFGLPLDLALRRFQVLHHGFGPGLDVEFFVDSAEVGANRVYADAQLIGDLFIG